ncbi:MAG TPA: CPBP family glutamic-type intramembrane protease [Sphingomicrobium sp.]|nr:CPBP family glutamic-type intramembrane protease [Sphingomicrobium sp.]
MIIRHRLSDLIAGLRHGPDRGGWLRALAELAWTLPVMLLIAHFGGLIHLAPPTDAITSIGLAATLFVAPALGEELVFRGLIIPRDHPSARWIILAAALFVLWHPLQAVTIGPAWSGAFLDPWFLGAVAVLGTALGRIYAATKSLWPPILVHWFVVASWKLFLGGPF